MLHMASVARPVPAAGAHAGTRREAARLPAPPPQRVRQRATAAAAAPRRHERRRLEVAACHRCLQQTQRQLIPRLQQHGSRGPGGPNVLKEGSAARAADTAADAAQRAPAPPERQQQAGQKQQQPGQQGQQEDTAGVRAALTALRFYKAAISPLLPPACRFLPTCSAYAMDAFQRYGVGKGFVLTAWRLLRCTPWGDSGYDPVRWPPPHLERLFRE